MTSRRLPLSSVCCRCRCDAGLPVGRRPRNHERREGPQAGVRHQQLRRLLDDRPARRREGRRRAGGRGSRVQAHARRQRRRTAAHRRRPADQGRGRDRHFARRSAEPDGDDQLRRRSARWCSRRTATRRRRDRVCYIGTDNVAAGRQAGQLIREAIPEGGSIMLFVGKLDAQNAQERIQGIREALAGSNIRIIDVRTDDADDVAREGERRRHAGALSRHQGAGRVCGATTAPPSSTPCARPAKSGACESWRSTRRTRRSPA